MKFSEKGAGGSKAVRKFSGNSSVFGETGFPNRASSGGASLHHGSFLAYKQDFPRLPTSYERLCVNIQSDKFEDISISSKPVYSNDHNLRHDQTFRFATLIKHQCNHIQCNVSAHTAVQLRTLHWFAPELLVILAGST